jgi:hypothetical protein
MVHKCLLALGTLLAAFLSSPLYSQLPPGSPNFRLAAITGETAPVPSTLSSISLFSFNDQGQVAFIADGGLLLKSAAGTSVIAAFGTHAPGGGIFLSADMPAINNNGEVVFRGQVTFPGKSGLFLFSAGTITQLVADLSMAPTGEFVFPVSPAINNNGMVIFVDQNTGALFLFSAGSLTRLAAPGDPVPGGGVFSAFFEPAINQSGQIAVIGFTTTGDGIFLLSGGSMIRIVATGDVLADGSVFSFVVSNPAINDSGQVAFGAEANSLSDTGLDFYSNGQLITLIPQFAPLPGGGVLFFVVSVSLNNADQISFVTDEAQVFVFSGGSGVELAADSQPSPDRDIFTTLSSIQPDSRINNAGQVLFRFGLIHESDALYQFSGNTVRVAGSGDTVPQVATFESPRPFGISLDGTVGVIDSVFPGNTGLFRANDANSSPGLIAHVGQLSANHVINIIDRGVINQNGQVALMTDTALGRSSIILASGGNLATLADESSPVNPFLGSIAINNHADIVFPGFNGSFGLFLISNGQISQLVNESVPLPDGNILQDAENLSLNDNDDLVLIGRFFFGNIIYEVSQGNVIRLAADGDPAPGGGTFIISFDNLTGLGINNHRQIVFNAFASTSGSGIFLNDNGNASRIVGAGDQAPDGGSFLIVGSPVINNAGQIAFFGQTSVSQSAIFVFTGSRIVEVAHAQGQLQNLGSPQINDNGVVAFSGQVADGRTAVFVSEAATH